MATKVGESDKYEGDAILDLGLGVVSKWRSGGSTCTNVWGLGGQRFEWWPEVGAALEVGDEMEARGLKVEDESGFRSFLFCVYFFLNF